MPAYATRSLLIEVIPESAPSVDAIDLGTALEKACFLDSTLEGAYRRYFVKTDERPLGLSWTGILEFLLKSKDQAVALCKAIRMAFRGRSVKIRIRSRDKEVEVIARNTDLDELRRAVEGLLKSVEKMK